MKQDYLKIRASLTEKEAFQIASWLSGLSLSAWCRLALRKAAEKELRESNKSVPFLEEK